MAESEALRSDIDDATRERRAPTATLRIVVAVLTYARTHGLPETVRALLAECSTLVAASVLVIDNNPAGDAQPVIRALMEEAAPDALQYVHEPKPGIASARNRAMVESAAADILIFVDDDEHPTAGWLRVLIRLYEQRKPAAIAGPVVSEFSGTVDPWIEAGRYFSRRRMPTGRLIDVAATNNLLLDMAQVRTAGITFDDRFGLTGGEDTLFTKRLRAAGGEILWCDEAIVIDKVPASRLTRRWVLRKAFSMGNTLVRVDLALARSVPDRLAIRVRCAVGGLARVAVGAVRCGLGMVTRSLTHRARGARLGARGAGMVLGAAGYAHVQYARRSEGGGQRRLFAGRRRGRT